MSGIISCPQQADKAVVRTDRDGEPSSVDLRKSPVSRQALGPLCQICRVDGLKARLREAARPRATIAPSLNLGLFPVRECA